MIFFTPELIMHRGRVIGPNLGCTMDGMSNAKKVSNRIFLEKEYHLTISLVSGALIEESRKMLLVEFDFLRRDLLGGVA